MENPKGDPYHSPKDSQGSESPRHEKSSCHHASQQHTLRQAMHVLRIGHPNYLEVHPRARNWLITMVIVRTLRIGLWDPNGHSWLINGGDPNHLLTGMILQVASSKLTPPETSVFMCFWGTMVTACLMLEKTQSILPNVGTHGGSPWSK